MTTFTAAQILAAEEIARETIDDYTDQHVQKILARLPYGEWCRKPKTCYAIGYCPQNPTCGD